MFLLSLASGRGSFVKTASVVPDGFEVAVNCELSTRVYSMIGSIQINFRVSVVGLSLSCSSFLVERSTLYRSAMPSRLM